MADGLLKLCGEPSVPGLALPKAFESLENHLETAASLCKLKGTDESQVTGLLIVCGELQRLLRLAFIENGILASRIEMLSCYQDDFIRRCEKRIKGFDIEQKVNRRYLKKLRQRQSKYETVRRKKEAPEWEVDVSCSDYDTVATLSRITGCPNLEFMLRVNQLLLDFVKDSDINELSLPPMGTEERVELSKLASLYKLRCRFNKSTQVASSTIIKARQTSLPAPGEIDNLLNTFTKKIKDGDAIVDIGSPKNETEKGANEATTANSNTASNKDTPSVKPPPVSTTAPPVTVSSTSTVTKSDSSVPSYMLTPVSSIGTPTITLEGSADPPTVPLLLKDSGGKLPHEEAISESPLPPLYSATHTKLPKPDGTVGHALLKLLPDSFDPSSAGPRMNPATKSQPVLPSSLPGSAYANLYSSPSTAGLPSPSAIQIPSTVGLPSPSAIQMALLMQSHQQLRALSAAAAAVTGGQGPPIPHTTVPLTSPTSSRSTVLATPLPLSLSGGSVKREGDRGGAGSYKRPKISRRTDTRKSQQH